MSLLKRAIASGMPETVHFLATPIDTPKLCGSPRVQPAFYSRLQRNSYMTSTPPQGASDHAFHVMSCASALHVHECSYIPGPYCSEAGQSSSQSSFAQSDWSQTCCTLSSAWRPVSEQCQQQSALLQTSYQPCGATESGC